MQLHLYNVSKEDEIYNWLKGDQDFNEGKILYFKYGNNVNLKRKFDRPISDYSIQKLEQSLKKIIGDYEPKVKPVKSKSIIDGREPLPITNKIKKTSLPVNYPEELKEAIKERQKCYRTRDRLHAQLILLPTDRKRYAAQKEMMRAQKRLIEIWEALDYYDTHNVVLPSFQQQPDLLSFHELHKRQSTLKTYLSRYKHPESKKAKKLLEKYQKEMHEIRKQLGEL